LQRGQRFLKSLEPLAVFLRAPGKLSVILGNGVGEILYLLAQARQYFHVTLATFDLLIQNHAVEPFAAFREFLRKIKMGARSKAEAIDVLLHHVLRFLD